LGRGRRLRLARRRRTPLVCPEADLAWQAMTHAGSPLHASAAGSDQHDDDRNEGGPGEDGAAHIAAHYDAHSSK